ncbi:uncharacterized protein JCM6883_005013 [Sporobolomyces salmoneus]|uniref:uncharacterized protein n=1 Tax=Sporobolomyces salmoneus TaxID=183962 RepID=UPI00316EEC81
MITRQAVPALLHRLSQSLPPTVPKPTHYLLPLLASTTLGHGSTFLPACLSLAYKHLPPTPSPVPPEPLNPLEDGKLHPRRFVSRLIKESLVKSAILIGVPRAIEIMLEFTELVEEKDRSMGFVREKLDCGSTTHGSRKEAGRSGLGTVYKGNIDEIFDKLRAGGLEDVRCFSEHITYGTFLTPYPSSSSPSSPSPDPFSSDPRLLSLLTLSCLIPQSTPREIHWHLRGALRRGWTREEVEAVQQGIEMVCESVGTKLSKDLPRVKDVDRQVEENE